MKTERERARKKAGERERWITANKISRLAIHLIKWSTQPLDDLRRHMKRLAVMRTFRCEWNDHHTMNYNEYVTIMNSTYTEYISIYMWIFRFSLELHILRKSIAINNKWTKRKKYCWFDLPVLYVTLWLDFRLFFCCPVDWSTIDGCFFFFSLSLLSCFFFHKFPYKEANFQVTAKYVCNYHSK